MIRSDTTEVQSRKWKVGDIAEFGNNRSGRVRRVKSNCLVVDDGETTWYVPSDEARLRCAEQAEIHHADRIATALERIATVLEKLREDNEPYK